MIPDAEKELKEKAQKVADQRKKDDGTYYATLRSEWVNKDKLKRFFEFGQKINLVNKAFFENGRESRVIGWEFNLDIPWDSPVYTIGESMPYSRLNDVEEKLESITYKGHTYVGGGGSSIYVIKTNDSTAPSDSNVFSAKRSLATLLRKDKEDQTNYLIKLLGGIISPFLTSPDFVTGMMGAGMSFSSEEGGESVGWIDKLYVRKKAIFQVLSIMETELAGASFLFNASGARATITKVERIDAVPFYYSDGSAKYYSDGSRAYVQPSAHGAVYRCYFLTDDGEKAIENRFRVGNLVRSQTFNIKPGVYENVSNHYWWRLVTGVGKDWIEVSVNHCDTDSDIPAVGDVIVQLGDISDPDYQSAIVLSAYGDGAPYLTFYQGINSYSLSGKDVFTIGYDRLVNVYGRTYIGERDNTRYFDLSGGKLKIKADSFIFSTGESVSDQFNELGERLTTEIKAVNGAISLKVSSSDFNTTISGINQSLNGKADTSKLLSTGIDITSGKITVTADKFLLKSTSGSPLAVFTEKDGKPFLKTECIDVNSLKVKHLDSADGSINIAGGKIALNDDGSGKLANGHISWDSAGAMSFKTGDSGERIELSSYSNSIVFCGDDGIHYLSMEYFSSGDSRYSRINMNDKRGRVTTIGPGSINMVFYNDGGIVQDERGEYNITLGSFFQMYHKTKDRLVVITPSKMQFNDGGTIYKGYTGTAEYVPPNGYSKTLYFKNGILYKIG